MISVVHNQRGRFGKRVESSDLSLFHVTAGLDESGVVLGIISIGEALRSKRTLTLKVSRRDSLRLWGRG